MATFEVTFIDFPDRDMEEVSADHYSDNPPFVDFMKDSHTNEGWLTVARYRADDIKRIIRKD
jgi:hypothetical protein